MTFHDSASLRVPAADTELRRALTDTLFASPLSLIAGASAGTAAGVTAALLTKDPVIAAIGWAIPVVGGLRVAHGFTRRRHRAPGEDPERLYEAGAWLFSLLLGLLAFFTLTRSNDSGLHLLVASLAIGYAAGICARNAGRPRIALGQLSLAALPISPALAVSEDPAKLVLAVANLFFVLSLVDVTKKTFRVYEDAVSGARAREEETRRAMGALPVMTWTADTSGTSTYQSQHWRAFTGTSDIGSGNTKVGLVHPADWPRLNEDWSRAVRSGGDFEAQYRLLHRTGKYRWVLSRGTPERDPAGRVVRWHGVCLDIHDAKLVKDHPGSDPAAG